MGKKAGDMTGRVIGLLTVVERKFVEGPRGGKHVQWLCQCQCGNTVVKDASSLRRAKFLSCGCTKGNSATRKDHTGVRYGKAVGIRPTGESSKRKRAIWLWLCDCGTEFESVADTFVYRNYSAGCRSCSKASGAKAAGDRARTHGMCGTKEYRAWCSVKKRVFDTNDSHFPVYSKLGMDDALAKSFEAFYLEIGPYPCDGVRYSVDRIDNTRGYVIGNIRWATNEQQARNQGMRSTNTSGVTGVSIQVGRPGNFHAVACWQDLNGKQQRKSFSFKKYGEELAVLCAIEARDQAIRLLNMQGADYSPGHGK